MDSARCNEIPDCTTYDTSVTRYIDDTRADRFEVVISKLLLQLQGQIVSEYKRFSVLAPASDPPVSWHRKSSSSSSSVQDLDSDLNGSLEAPESKSPATASQAPRVVNFLKDEIQSDDLQDVPPTVTPGTVPGEKRRISARSVQTMQQAMRRASGVKSSEDVEDSPHTITPGTVPDEKRRISSRSVHTMQQAMRRASGVKSSKDDVEAPSDTDPPAMPKEFEEVRRRRTTFKEINTEDLDSIRKAHLESQDKLVRQSKAGVPDFEVLPVWKVVETSGPMTLRTGRTKSMIQVQTQKKEEETENKSHHPLMLTPGSHKRLLWEVVGSMLIGYECITIPLVAFDPPDSAITAVIAWFSCFFWSLNIPVSCLTGYIRGDGSVEMRFKQALRNYLTTWFSFDLFTVVLDVIEVANIDVAGSFWKFRKAFSVIRLLRLVRVVRSSPAIKFLTENVRSEEVQLMGTIARIIMMMVFVNHIMACIWWAVGVQSSNDLASRWITVYKVEDAPLIQRYTMSFHWSLALFAGNETQNPQNETELVLTVISLFFATISSWIFSSRVTTAMTQLQFITSHQISQVVTLRRYLNERGISRRLAGRVQQNAQFAIEEQKRNVLEENVELLKLISTPLLVELHFEIFSPVIMEHPFFRCYNEINSVGVLKVCHAAVSSLKLLHGDLLFSELERPSNPRMFFVVDGTVEYARTKSAEEARSGDWFAESVLWIQWTHVGTARAIERSTVYALDSEKFREALSTFPSDHARLYAEKFAELTNESKDDLSDLNALEEEIDALLEAAFPDEKSDDEDDDSVSSAESTPVSPPDIGKIVRFMAGTADDGSPGNGEDESAKRDRKRQSFFAKDNESSQSLCQRLLARVLGKPRDERMNMRRSTVGAAAMRRSYRRGPPPTRSFWSRCSEAVSSRCRGTEILQAIARWRGKSTEDVEEITSEVIPVGS